MVSRARSSNLVWKTSPFVGLLLVAACGGAEPAVNAPPPPPAAPVAQAPATPAKAPSFAPPPGIQASSLDASVSPCDDFFQYACGGWIKANPIPEDQAGWGSFSEIHERNETTLRQILEKDATKPDAADPYAKELGAFWTSCMDEAAVEKAGLKPLAAPMARIDAVTDPASLARALATLHLGRVSAFFEPGSEQDLKDSTQVIGVLDQGGLGMPDRDYYLKDDARTAGIRAKYLEHVQRIFELLGEKPEVAKAHAETVLKTEKTLAEASMARVDRRDPHKVYHRLDRAGVAKAAPTIPWDVYWKELGFPTVTAINVYSPDFLAAVDKMVAGAGKGPKSALATDIQPYLRYHLIAQYAERLPQKFVDEDFAFQRELTGAAKILPRWKRCVQAVDAGMGEALAQPFVKEKLGAEGKATTQQMVAAIEQSMQDDLQKISWMDDTTRARALEKLHKITNKIGYPDKWRKYDGLVIDKSYAGNALRATSFEMKRRLAKIGKPVDKAEWGMTPPTVNAYYNPSLNEMVFPAGILQTPFFSNDAPKTVNFGAIGMVMGHELTHGFDDEGRQFDGEGDLKDWWTPPVSAEFDKRAECVVKQFDGYVSVDDLHLNGKLTLGENIADLGGMKMAHAAMAKTQNGAPSPEAERQFFIGYAQGWCTSMRDEAKRVRVRIDPHSPPKFRVNGPLSNMSEFAQAFACPAGSPMVRSAENRCEVW